MHRKEMKQGDERHCKSTFEWVARGMTVIFDWRPE